MDTGWQEGKNLDTRQDGYHINHAGSLWAGQCNTQNTIAEILALTKNYHYEPFTSCRKDKIGGNWHFRGNFRELSNVFDVTIWNPRIARKAQRSILKSLNS